MDQEKNQNAPPIAKRLSFSSWLELTCSCLVTVAILITLLVYNSIESISLSSTKAVHANEKLFVLDPVLLAQVYLRDKSEREVFKELHDWHSRFDLPIILEWNWNKRILTMGVFADDFKDGKVCI